MRKIYLLIAFYLLSYQFTSLFAQSTDYIQVVLYGQSLGLGWQAPRAITDIALDNNYMMGTNVNTLYSTENTTLNPLVAKKWSKGGEQPIVSCLNAYSEAYRDKINANQKFIAVSAGEGGRTIERLSKECTNDGYYDSTFIESLDNTLAAINGQTVSCPAIIYMQGEYNAVPSAAYGQGLTPGTNGTQDKGVYKELLLKLKNNMQADIMSKYGQTEKPLFFIYQTSGSYVRIKELPIVMAQIEFAEENSDVVLLNPHYAMSDYGYGHLSTNGYRWFGELMSKSLISELVNDSPAKTLKPINFDISGNKITIDYDVPVPPLVLDTWTTPMQTNYGFVVYNNNSIVTINSVEIIGGNQVQITCNTDLTDKVEIVYSGSTVNGSGNLRDSDATMSMYTYFDDTADSLQESYTPTLQDGGSIYGQPYGLQNWSNMFYYKLREGVGYFAGDQFDDGLYTFQIIDPVTKTVMIAARNKAGSLAVSGDLVLPGTANGFSTQFTVVGTGESSFNGIYLPEMKNDVTSISIPASVTDIGFRTFRAAEKVESYTLSDGLVTIGGQAFYDNKSLTSIVIPNTVTTLGGSVFNGCSTLQSVTLSQNLLQIPDRIFTNCPAMTTLTVPASLTDFLANSWLTSSVRTLIMDGAVPPVINSGWAGTASNMTVYTDVANIPAYKAAPIWSDMTILDRATLSTNSLEKKLGFSIYPNPTSGLVSFSGLEDIIDITVFNITGSVLLNSKFTTQIDLSSLASGMYFMKVKTANGSSVKRVIKK
ncbi:leucine-rich repeat domain-containing protein [Mariniflexile gromovii]|uniref:Leucine-rich repeat domain-containing protein n=1 Tax=Mariniflexile gromovii TaxID=362523 RepID=A0ABS4BTA3_9FLAO|nr:leucine-rich repeat domain-containing protein [Mariniflexile gromovii]MBP0903828.1 leucine-rich repeat domain-containing protein [Mariniflexile gromovii]